MRQLIVVFCLLLACVVWADEPPPAGETLPLLLEAEQLFGDVQALANDWLAERESLPRDQLLVLVSLRPDPRFELQRIQLRIDGKLLVTHDYDAADIAALAAGGSHRLLLKSLPAGQHVLQAHWEGDVEDEEKAPQRDLSWRFRSGEIRRVVELELSQGKAQPAPQFLLREWN